MLQDTVNWDRIRAVTDLERASGTTAREVADCKRLQSIWRGMRQRCENPNNVAFAAYGARGIAVCEDWTLFNRFCSWALNHGYAAGLTLDRERNSEGYSPANCRWRTPTQQARNKTNNLNITIDGETLCAAEWAERTGHTTATILRRFHMGWKGAKLLQPLASNSRSHVRESM